MTTNQRFRPRERLRLRTDFARVFAQRCRAGNRALIVYVGRNERTWSRLGISTPKRLGNAVQRNAVRRRIREAFRKHKETLPSGLDIVCVVQPPARERGTELEEFFCGLVRKAAATLATRGQNRA